VKRIVLRVGVGALLATMFLVAAVLVFPARRHTFFGVYELVLGAIALAALVGSLRALQSRGWEARSPFDPRHEPPDPTVPVAELERIDRLVVLGSSNSFDLHFRLRPLLRQVAAERLHSRGVPLDRETERARELLGDEVWELVRADRELGQRSGPGIGLTELDRVVSALEEL
jgi:hypothetical protein